LSAKYFLVGKIFFVGNSLVFCSCDGLIVGGDKAAERR